MTAETSTSRIVRTSQPGPAVAERVTVTSAPAERRAYLAKPVDQWGWTDLRDFVVYEYERRNGPVRRRDAAKEAAIFKRFLKDWGWVGVMVAQAAFDEAGCDGVWRGAPVTIERFTKGCDSFFALPLAERIADAQDAQKTAN